MKYSPLDRTNWYGYLTTENAQSIAQRIEEMLTGKYYTFVATNEKYARPTDVRTSQKLDAEDSVNHKAVDCHMPDAESSLAHIIVCDSYGVWAFASTAATEAEACNGPHYNAVYITFDYTKIEVQHYNGFDELLTWIIAVENHDE